LLLCKHKEVNIMVVQHNLQAMNSNRMLNITTSAQAKSTEKLSSGYKINRAADDAAGLSISEKMRKQIRGLTQASSNAQDGISAVQTAEGALTEVQDMLQRMNELSVKAANGTMSESDRTAVQNEIDQLVTEIDRVSETTKFNETYLLKGDDTVDPKKTYEYTQKQYTAAQTLYDATGAEIKEGTVLDPAQTYYTGRTAAGASALSGGNGNPDNGLIEAVTMKSDKDVYTKDANGNIVAIAAGTEIAVGTTVYGSVKDAKDGTNGMAVGEGDSAATEDMKDGTTGSSAGSTLLDAADTAIGETWTIVKAKSSLDLYTVDANGVESKIAAGDSFKLTDQATIFKAVKYTPDQTKAVTADDFSKYGNDKQLMDADGNEVAANGLYSYFDEDGNYKGGLFKLDAAGKKTAATQADITQMVGKTEKEVGALTLTLHVGADATTNNQISVELDAMSASSLGIEGIKVDGKDDSNALNAIETVKAALQQVSEQRSALGAVQNRLEHTINNLDNVVENTTSAESAIRDTDIADEMVKYSNNNILQQAGTSMLSQANQSNQLALSLLG
jgi:flagellin